MKLKTILEKIETENLLTEKPADINDNDWYDFGEDFGVSVPRKLYARAIGVGISKKEIATLAQSKKLETVVADKEDDEKNKSEKEKWQKQNDRENKKDEINRKKIDAANEKLKKLCKDAKEDFENDNNDPELTIDQAAMDIATSMIYDSEIKKIQQILGKSKSQMIDLIANLLP